MVAMIAELLKRERMPHTTFRHPPAYTAQEQAAVSHVPGRCWAKVVLCIVDGQPTQAVLPAHTWWISSSFGCSPAPRPCGWHARTRAPLCTPTARSAPFHRSVGGTATGCLWRGAVWASPE